MGHTEENYVAGTEPTTDIEQAKKNYRDLRDKRFESIDFMTSWEEAEKRKKAVTPPEFQDKTHDCPCTK
jgi:gentisate 1,2-dioxygenase